MLVKVGKMILTTPRSGWNRKYQLPGKVEFYANMNCVKL